MPQAIFNPGIYQPLGLAYIAAFLERNHKILVIDALAKGWRSQQKKGNYNYFGLNLEEIVNEVTKFSPDVVGITVPFLGSTAAIQAAKAIKEAKRDTVTIFGGVDPTTRTRHYLSHSSVDFVVIGEGEVTMYELVKKIENQDEKKSFKEVQGIAYSLDGKIQVTSPRHFISDLDSLPFPARHLLPMNDYYSASRTYKIGVVGYVYDHRWTSIITSRGCPFHCVFCGTHLTMGRRWRARSPENVVDEIQHVVEKYRIRHICFDDDNLTLNPKRAKHLFQLMIDKDFDVSWSTPNGIRADTLDEELLRLMKRSGCKRIFVSPESGDQRVLNCIIGKQLDLRAIERAVSLCKKLKIRVDCSFVIGFIGETKEDIERTIEFGTKLRKMGMHRGAISIATPYPGTDLYEQAKSAGYLLRDFREEDILHRHTAFIETPDFTADELQRLIKKADRLMNPGTLSLTNLLDAIRRPSFALYVLRNRFLKKIKL